MEARVIKDYDPTNHNITNEFLIESNDWDLVELNYNLDGAQLKQWWDEILLQFPNTIFNFNKNYDKLNLEKSKEMVENGYCGYYCGPIDGITLAWPVEKYEPLPPPHQCNVEMYPEVNIDTFIHDAKVLPKYKFGYYSFLIDLFGEDAFRQSIASRHYPGMYIRQHLDSKRLKLHIPVETTEETLFHFGKERERKYHMKLGKAYILNTGDWHGTSNETPNFRTHLISRIMPSQLQHIISLTNAN